MKNTRKSRKMHKLLAMVSCALLLVAISVGATVAYLTSTTEVVTNTFTIGNVNITLDEAKVDLYGVADTEAARVIENTYKLVPGHNYAKDPTVHVTKGSEECYLFVEVTNAIEGIEADTTIATQMDNNGWTAIEEGSNIYVYETPVDAREEAQDVIVFEEFTILDDAELVDYVDKTVTVKAYAVQADGFENSTAAEIWEAAFGA